MNQQGKRPDRPLNDDDIVYDVEVIEENDVVQESADQQASNLLPEAIATPQPNEDKLNLIERILSPQSLQIMMAAGGGILALGLAIWLWSQGVFEEPIVGAVCLGIGNLGLLGAGLWLHAKTRYKIAGRGLTLLSSLLLPLNLWFYEAQDLISLQQGGHLWIPALVISGIYALIARVTRDSMFVYTLVGGLLMTGLLFLANPAIGSLWAVIPTSTFLIVLGTLCTVVDRAFREKSGAFSREEFGKAFFNAGQAVVMIGLSTLAVGQGLDLEANLWNHPNQVWAIGMIILAGCTYAYSHMTRPQGFLYPAVVIGLIGWIGLLALDLFAIQITYNLITLGIAIGLIAANLWYRTLQHSLKGKDKSLSTADKQISEFVIPICEVALIVLGIGQFIGGLVLGAELFNATFVVQLIATGVAVWTAPGVWLNKKRNVGVEYSVLGGAIMMTLAAITAALTVTAVSVAPIGAMVGGLVVATFLIGVATAMRGTELQKRIYIGAAGSTAVVASTAGTMMFLGAIAFPAWEGIALMAAITGFFVFLERATRSRTIAFCAAATALVVGAQFVVMYDLANAYALTIGLSCLGMTILGLSKVWRKAFSNKALATIEPSGNLSATNAISKVSTYDILGNVLILAGSLGAGLFTCTQLIDSHAGFQHIGLLAFQLIPIFVGWFANCNEAWKRTFITAGLITAAMGVVTSVSLSQLTFIQRIEMGSLIYGLIMVVAGYFGWSQEKEEKANLVSFQLIFGSLCLAVPMIVGLAAYRVVGIETVDLAWRQLHEIGGLIIGLGLLGSGVLSRIRSTTLAGAAVMLTYVVSILFLIQWPKQLESVSFMMMIGGGAFFAVAILLSFYRDRLLSLPERVREGRGLFKVLKWR